MTASRAVLHWQQQRLRVTGTARPEEGIDHRWEAPGSGAWFHLVPVVDESWEEGDPVPLWITTASGRDDAASWKAALTAALQRGPIEVEIVAKAGLDPRERPTGWHAALEALAAADGLSTDANAPIAMWPLP